MAIKGHESHLFSPKNFLKFSPCLLASYFLFCNHFAFAYYNIGMFWKAPTAQSITLRACTSGETVNAFGATTILPPGTANGDLVVVALQAANPITTAAGYTQQYIDNPSGTALYFGIYTHPFLTGDTTAPYFNFFTANSVWVTCSYENVGGVEGAAGADISNSSSNSIDSATGSGLTTTFAQDKLIAVYSGTLFNGTATSLIYPGSLVEEIAVDGGSPYLWFSDETIGGSGVSTGRMTATASQVLLNFGAQLLLHP